MLEGAIESTPVLGLLRSLSERWASGVLWLYSTGARVKCLEFSGGLVSASARGEESPADLGRLLLAGGRISRHALVDAVRRSRVEGGKVPDILVASGAISAQDLDRAVRFFLEEEIADVLFWESGRYRFEEDVRLATAPAGDVLRPREGASPIDAVDRVEKLRGRWNELGPFIPSADAPLRLTRQGGDLLATVEHGARSAEDHIEEWMATYAPDVETGFLGRRILELAAEGWSAGAITLKTSTGRVGILGALAELSRAGLVEEVPEGELQALGEGFTRSRRYEHAIGAFEALAAREEDPRRRAAFRRAIRDCEEALEIISATEHGEVAAPGAGRARAVIPESWGRYAGALILVLIVLVGVAVFSIPTLRRWAVGENMLAFREADAKAKELVAGGDHVAAMYVYQRYLSNNPEGLGSDLARMRYDEIKDAFEKMAENELRRAESLEASGDYLHAAGTYRRMLEALAGSSRIPEVRGRLRAAEEKQAARAREMTESDLRARLERALAVEREGCPAEAMGILREVAATGTAPAADASRELVRLEELARRSRAACEAASALERSGRPEKAMESFAEAARLAPDSKEGRDAAVKASELERRKRTARFLLDEAERSRSAGKADEALRKYVLIKQSFAGFSEAAAAEEHLLDMTHMAERVKQMLDEAAAHEAAGREAEAFAIRRKVLSEYPNCEMARRITLPVRIESVPSGAAVSRGGEALGATPLAVRLGGFESGELRFALDGFEDLFLKYDKVREMTLTARLQKKLLWTAELGAKPLGRPGPGDRIYAPAGRAVVALERSSGKVLWRTNVTMSYASVAGAAETKVLLGPEDPDALFLRGSMASTFGDRIIVGTQDGFLVQLDSKTGEVASRVALGAAVDSGIIFGNYVTYPKNRPSGWFADSAGMVHALDGQGELVGEALKLSGAPVCEGVAFGPFACFTAGRRSLVAIGEKGIAWTVATQGDITTPPSARGTGPCCILALASQDGLRGISHDGEIKSFRRTTDVELLWPCVGGGTVAASAGLGRVKCFAFDDLSELWTAALDAEVVSAPAWAGGPSPGRYYFGTRAGSVWCLDEKTGAILWSRRLGGAVTAPLVVHDKVLYVGTADGKLTAIPAE